MLISILVLVVSIVVMRKCSGFDIAANYLTKDIGEGIKGPTINAVASSSGVINFINFVLL